MSDIGVSARFLVSDHKLLVGDFLKVVQIAARTKRQNLIFQGNAIQNKLSFSLVDKIL